MAATCGVEDNELPSFGREQVVLAGSEPRGSVFGAEADPLRLVEIGQGRQGDGRIFGESVQEVQPPILSVHSGHPARNATILVCLEERRSAAVQHLQLLDALQQSTTVEQFEERGVVGGDGDGVAVLQDALQEVGVAVVELLTAVQGDVSGLVVDALHQADLTSERQDGGEVVLCAVQISASISGDDSTR